MSQQISRIKDCYDVIYRVSDYARYVVYYETAYDIIDEISRSALDLTKVLDGLQKLSRLAAKVINDLNKVINDLNDESSQKKANSDQKQEKGQEGEKKENEKKANSDQLEVIKNIIINQLKAWGSDYQNFIDCLK
ncbi:MAG: hypothetical protein C0176_03085, partial [Mesoaciditoga sp.]